MGPIFPGQAGSSAGKPQPKTGELPRPLKVAFTASNAFVLGMPFLRTLVPWKRMPVVAVGMWGATFTAGLLWKAQFGQEPTDEASLRDKY